MSFQIGWFITKLVITLIAAFTSFAGCKILFLYYDTIKQSKTQLWFYFTGLFTILLGTVYMWIPFNKNMELSDCLLGLLLISEAGFAWCQTLNFLLLRESLQ